MHQENLWGSAPRPVGLTIYYQCSIVGVDMPAELIVTPHWSKGPVSKGSWRGTFESTDPDRVNAAINGAWRGYSSGDPGNRMGIHIARSLSAYDQYTAPKRQYL